MVTQHKITANEKIFISDKIVLILTDEKPSICKSEKIIDVVIINNNSFSLTRKNNMPNTMKAEIARIMFPVNKI